MIFSGLFAFGTSDWAEFVVGASVVEGIEIGSIFGAGGAFRV